METQFAQTYRNVQKEVQSESDSSDSDSSDDAWKRRSSRKRMMPKSPAKSTELPLTTDNSVAINVKKRKLNTVWCNVLQEQTVSDDLIQFGLKPKPVSFQDRSCESYDFTLGATDPRRDSPILESDLSNEKDNCEAELKFDGGDNVNSDHKNISQRRWPKVEQENPDVVNKVAKKIIKALNEPKHFIIYRVVRMIGTKKALELLEETEKIEDNGGMFVLDNSRRRTPGGTFLQLIKKDASISNKKKSKIFAEDRKVLCGRALKSKNSKKKRKSKKKAEAMDIVCDPDDANKEENETEENEEETNEKKEEVVAENDILNSSNGTDTTDVVNNACSKGVSDLEEGEITD